MSLAVPPLRHVVWPSTHRIIRSIYPPADLFEDIADPADWELIASAEAKTNPRVRDQVGAIHLVPPERRVTGPGASWAMAPFTHVSEDRPSRFSAGTYGVYYAGDRFEVALAETVHHFGLFMRRTREPPAMADFRELVGRLDATLHDLRGDHRFEAALDPEDWRAAQELGRRLRDAEASDGLVYPSVRWPAGDAVAAFWPDVAGVPVQGRHLCYRWTGDRVDAYLVYGAGAWTPL